MSVEHCVSVEHCTPWGLLCPHMRPLSTAHHGGWRRKSLLVHTGWDVQRKSYMMESRLHGADQNIGCSQWLADTRFSFRGQQWKSPPAWWVLFTPHLQGDTRSCKFSAHESPGFFWHNRRDGFWLRKAAGFTGENVCAKSLLAIRLKVNPGLIFNLHCRIYCSL